VDPIAGLGRLDDVENRKILDSKSDSPFLQPIASRYTDYAIPAVPFLSQLYAYMVFSVHVTRSSVLQFYLVHCCVCEGRGLISL
jgi:hypothetical protein